MPSSNPDLVIRLRANSDDLTRGFRSAEAAAKVMERELNRLEAAQRAMAASEAAAYREEAQRNAAREQAIRRMAALEAQAYREEAQRVAARRRQIEEVQKAEADAYREQARRDAQATAQRTRNLEEIRRAEDAAYREQARRDATATAQRQRNLDEVRRAEDAAYREQARRNQRAADERQRQLDEVRRAEAAAYAEQARRDAAAARAAERAAEAERRRIERRRQAMTELGTAGVAMGAAIAAGLALSVRAASEWESAWAGVTKTVNGSDKEMAQLEQQLRGLARVLPVSSTEIAGVAEAAGQLGIKRQDVAKFTQVMIGLGKATNLTSEDAAVELARLMNIMGTAPQDVDRLGATIVNLGNNFATTEAEITGMSLRIAGAGKVIGLTESQVMGIATALSSVGIEVEAGGSAISTIMIKMAQAVSQGGGSLDAFAQTAGMTSQEFAKAYGENAAGALTAFEEGLGKTITTGGDAFAVLTDLGITEIRQRDAVLRLASARGLLNRALEVGNEGWVENTALMNEVNKRYATSASRFQLAKNELNDLAIDIGAELLPALTHAAGDVGQLAREFNELPDGVKSGVAIVGSLAAAIGLVGGGAAIAAPRLAQLAANLTALGSGGAGIASRLSRVAGILAGPWGLAVAGAVVGLGMLMDKHLQAKKNVDALTSAIQADSNAIGDNTKAAVAASFADDGTYERAKKLGIALNVVTAAATGNSGAMAELKRQYAEAREAASASQVSMEGVTSETDAARIASQNLSNADSKRAVELNKLIDSVNGESSAVGEASNKARLAAEGQEEYAGASDSAAESLDGVAGAAGEAGDAAGEMGKAAREAGRGLVYLGDDAGKDASEALQDLGVQMGITLEQILAARDGLTETATGFGDFATVYSDALEKKKSAEQDSAKASAKAAGDSSDAWKDATDNVKLSLGEFKKALDDAAKAQENYQSNFDKLAPRISADFLTYLAQLGPEYAGLIQQMADDTDAGLAELEDKWRRGSASNMKVWADQMLAAQPILSRIAQESGEEVAQKYTAMLRRGEISVGEIANRWGATIRFAVPDVVETKFVALGTKDAQRQISDLQNAIKALPNEKSIRVNVFDAQGNARTSTVTRNADGTVTTRTDLGRSTKYAVGGPVHGAGTATSDSIPALLSDGEYVIRAAAVDRYGPGFLDEVNAMRFATGGRVRADGTAPTTNVDLSLPDPVQVTSSVNSDLSAIADSVQAAAAAAAALAGSDSSETPGQGTLAAGGQGMGWQWQIATLRKAFPGLALNSGFRPGSKTVSGNTSYHARGRAVDVPPRMDVFNWLLANYGNSPEIIFSPANGRQIKNGRPHTYTGAVRAMHFNHVHWAYDQGGLAEGIGWMPKLTNKPERVLDPRTTVSFEKLVDVLGGRYAGGGVVISRGTRTGMPGGPNVATNSGTSTSTVAGGARGSLVAGQNAQTGSLSFNNGFNVDSYLRRAMTPISIKIDDSALREANFLVTQWTSALAMANQELAAATTKAEFWGDEVKDAEDKIADAQRDQESAAKDLATAQQRLTKARASKDAGDIAEANQDVTDALNAQKTATATVRDQTERLTRARATANVANRELYDATQKQASAESLLTDLQQRAADAQEKLNQAKADALAYAQKIAEAARSGAEVTGLFSAEDAARALKYAQAAYAASQAEAQAATDATTYQEKIDQLASAGAKLAAAQAAMGASYAVQKATIQGTRDEVEKLALSYGFTAQQARDLAESAVPLANTGQTLVDSLTRQLKAVQDFSRAVDTLRALGLSQGLIDQIMEAGPEKGLQVAQELISGGKDMVKRLNDLQAQLVAASDNLGRTASNAAYGTGTSTPTMSVAPVISRGPRITRAGGGPVRGPGTATSDSIPAYLSDGEYVVRAAAVARYGEHFFDSVNAMRLGSGGMVAAASPAFAAPAMPTVVVQTTEYSGTQVHGPLLAVDTVEKDVDLELLLRAMPTGVGALGRGGGRR